VAGDFTPQPWIGKGLEGQRGPASDRTGAVNTSAELIFERFYRANDPLVPMHPGTGLGLYISRQLAERHNGKLTVAYSGTERTRPGRRRPIQAPAVSGVLTPSP